MKLACIWTLGALLAVACAAAGFADTPVPQPTLKVGDPAPKLEPAVWLKGEPVKQYKPGHVYVVEFWATWCAPCNGAMPGLSALQKEFAGRVTVVGVDISEDQHGADPSVERVRKFVEKKGDYMAYTVAMDDQTTNSVRKTWMEAAGSGGIPTAFIVDKTGRLTWVGYPTSEEEEFHTAIEQAIAGTSDLTLGRNNQAEMSKDAVEGKARQEIIGPMYDAYFKKDYPRLLAESDKLIADPKYQSMASNLKLLALLHIDEKEAWNFARTHVGKSWESYPPGFSEQDKVDAYWNDVAMTVADAEGLSQASYRKAIEYLSAASVKQPDSMNVWFALSQAQRHIGKLTDAIHSQEQGIKAARDHNGFSDYDVIPLQETLAELRALQQKELETPVNAIDVKSARDLRPTLAIGDPAPPLPAKTWLRGEPVTRFEPGQVYVVDFWATWCGPCIALMPHMSELQKKHAGKLTVIGVNIRENTRSSGTTPEKVVDKQGDKIAYRIAVDDPVREPIYASWSYAAGANTLPTLFIVDGTGTIVWIGYPARGGEDAFEIALEQALQGKSDLAAARASAQKQFVGDAISMRFYWAMQKKWHRNEAEAIAFAKEVAADEEMRKAVADSSIEAAYWGRIAAGIVAEDGLSPATYRLAVGYLEKDIAVEPDNFPSLMSLAQAHNRLGEKQQAIAAQEAVVAAARKRGLPQDSITAFEQMLADYRK